MGKLRVETIAKLLVSSESTERIHRDFASTKTLKLWLKHPEASGSDIYEKCRPHTEKLIQQAAVAKLFMSPQMKEKIVDQSAKGAALTSEQMGRILKYCSGLKSAATHIDHVEAYAGLIDILINSSEPLVKGTVKKILIQIDKDMPSHLHRESFLRPLAVAIGLRLDGLPGEKGYEENLCSFLDAHFSKDLTGIACALKREGQGVENSQQTVELFRACLSGSVNHKLPAITAIINSQCVDL